MPVAGWWEALFPDPAAIVRSLGVSGNVVVDLCSGDGWFTRPIAMIATRVFAVDIDPDLHAVARSRLAESGIANVDHITANAFDLPELVPFPVDVVFMANCFHGVPDGARLASVIERVLAPEGRFVVLNWHKQPRDSTPVLGEPRGPKTELRLSPEQTTASIEAGGLRRVDLIGIPPYHYAALFKRG